MQRNGTPPNLVKCKVKIEFDDEIYFRFAYYDEKHNNWRDAVTDNILMSVKGWEIV